VVERTNEGWLAGLDFRRLGVEEGGEGLEFRGKMAGCGFHGWGCRFLTLAHRCHHSLQLPLITPQGELQQQCLHSDLRWLLAGSLLI